MTLAVMILFQAATAEPSTHEGAARDWNVRIVPQRRCASSDDEIVVCGSRRDDRYRLPALSSEFETGPLRAETELIDGVAAGLAVESATFPDGTTSKRLMVRFKTKF